MPRVGFAIAYYDSFTGAQQSMSLLIKNSKNISPVLISPKHGECVDRISGDSIDECIIKYPESLDKFGGELFNEGIIKDSISSAQLFRYYYNVFKKLYQLDLDILYCNNLRALLLFGPPAKILGIPLIWYVRIDTPIPTFDNIGLRLADEIVTISDGVQNRFAEDSLEKHNDRIRTIYTGVDLERFNPKKQYGNPYDLDQEVLTIVEIASINRRKGQDKVIDAVARIQNEIPEFQLVFAGSVPDSQEEYSTKIQKQVQEVGLQEEVSFLGWCDNIPGLLSQSDLFVLPSSNEGLPRSILEAFAMGVPTIATPAGGTTELLHDEENGLVVPMDDVEELSRAIRLLAKDQELRKSYGANARSLIEERFSKESYVENFEDLIEEILS